MTVMGTILLVLSTFFLGWHFFVSGRPDGVGPLITRNTTFMDASWLVAVLAGMGAAILIGLGSGLLWGIGGIVGLLVLPFPMSLIHHAMYSSIRRRMAKKPGRQTREG
jgi:hypothetical protein